MTRLQKMLVAVMAFSIAIAFFSFIKKTDKKITRSATTAPVLFKIIVIKHAVADFDKWKVGYMANDSIRQAYGISQYAIGRGMENPNMVIVIDKMTDLQKAKDFSMLPGLKDAMQKAGVISKPSFAFANVIRNDDTKIEVVDRVLISHHVKNFETWLKEFDGEGSAKRAANGLLDRGLAQAAEDPNMVYIVFAITDMAKAKARMNSDELKKIMTDAGVEGAPDIFMYKLTK
jgi:quinol monooxygenase YgiN